MGYEKVASERDSRAECISFPPAGGFPATKMIFSLSLSTRECHSGSGGQGKKKLAKLQRHKSTEGGKHGFYFPVPNMCEAQEKGAAHPEQACIHRHELMVV